jgi:YD repeat-containing protein
VGSETHGRGFTITYLYDAAMRPTKITPPIGNPTTIIYEYDTSGYLTSKNEQRGSFSTRTSYNGLGRKTGTSNSLGITTGIAYTSCGLTQSTTSSIGDTTLFDAFGRTTQVTHKDNTRKLYNYQSDSQLQITDESNNTQTHYFQWFGNPADNTLSKVVDPLNQTMEYFYNILGSLIKAQGSGRTDSYGYDGKNFLVIESHPESGTTTYTRDGVGNIKTIQDGLGTRTLQYDAINRLLSDSSGSIARSYTHDNANNLVTVTMLMAMEKCTSFGNSKVYHPSNGKSPEGATLAS